MSVLLDIVFLDIRASCSLAVRAVRMLNEFYAVSPVDVVLWCHSHMCSIHNRMRSISCLQEAGGGAFVCTPDSACRASVETQPFYAAVPWEPPRAFGGKGASKGTKDKSAEEKGFCLLHTKWRSFGGKSMEALMSPINLSGAARC